MRLAQGTAEAARLELRGVLAVQAARDVELASARHGFETDEILVVSVGCCRGGGTRACWARKGGISAGSGGGKSMTRWR